MLIRFSVFVLMLIFSFGAFAQKNGLDSLNTPEKIEERKRRYQKMIAESAERRRQEQMREQMLRDSMQLVQDSIQLAFDKTVAKFEMTKAKLDSLSQALDSFDALYRSENVHKKMSLLSQNKNKIADYLIVKDFWALVFNIENGDDEFVYTGTLKNEISFFDKEIDRKMSEFVFNKDLIWSLVYSYEELYGKEIAILFVEKKLKETYSEGNKKQNLTLLLERLKGN